MKHKKTPHDCPFRNSELRVLPYIVHGFTDKEIADKMILSEDTITTHRTNMMNVTGCKNAAQLSSMSVAKGWAEFDEHTNLKPLLPRKGSKDKFLR